MTREARFSGPLFAAFCLRGPADDGPRIGLHRAARAGQGGGAQPDQAAHAGGRPLRLDGLNQAWSIVINPRSRSLDAPAAELEREVERLFQRCNGSS